MKRLVFLLLLIPAVFSLTSCGEDTPIPDPCSTVMCDNGGTCDAGICDCPDGFSGTTCEIDACASVLCLNGGVCVTGNCDCPDGFTGTNCETIVTGPCDGVNCFNGGTCIDGTCDCPPGFTGANCETAVTGPVANFSFTGGNCLAPCIVSFTNSSNNSTSFAWDFGDGNTSTAQSPSHTYLQGGIYNVSLTAMGDGGTDIITKVVSIVGPTKCILNKATLTVMPFVNASTGVSWDSSDGPDVFFEVNDVSYNSFYVSDEFTNVTPGQIPLEWNISGGFEFPDFETLYYFDIWDNDANEGGGKAGIITNVSFNLGDLIIGDNPYPTSIVITNSNGDASATLELTWE